MKFGQMEASAAANPTAGEGKATSTSQDKAKRIPAKMRGKRKFGTKAAAKALGRRR